MKIFDKTLLQLAKKNKNIVVLNSSCKKEAGLENFAKFFDNRFFNMGLSESNMTSCASGFAIMNKIPLIFGYSSFITGRAFQQIKDCICFPNLNVKIIGLSAGLSAGQEGAGFHALQDISIMRSLPNMKILTPFDLVSAGEMLQKMTDEFGPVYLRLYEGILPESSFGKDLLKEKNNKNFDVIVFTYGAMLEKAFLVKELLKEQNINLKVVNVDCLKPLDEEKILSSLNMQERKENEKILIVSLEDHSVIGGLGDVILDFLNKQNCNFKLLKLGVNDEVSESAVVEDLYEKFGLDSKSVCEKILGFV